jgi:hypothetical protein
VHCNISDAAWWIRATSHDDETAVFALLQANADVFRKRLPTRRHATVATFNKTLEMRSCKARA